MIKADTASVTPTVKSNSITIRNGTQTVVGVGTNRKTTKSTASGIHDRTQFTAVTRMVSRGKHSRGNWVLLMRALLVSREGPPVPNDWAQKVQHRMTM